MITFLKKTFNISGCEIIIEPDRSVYHQGDFINCTFKITGSKEFEQIANEISISLDKISISLDRISRFVIRY